MHVLIMVMVFQAVDYPQRRYRIIFRSAMGPIYAFLQNVLIIVLYFFPIFIGDKIRSEFM